VSRTPASELAPLVKLLTEDRRYKLEAYQFVGAGLEYAQEVLGMGTPGPRKGRKKSKDRELELADERPVRHVTGQDLCQALRQLAHDQYGYLAKLVLASWGVQRTSDFGEIVYNLIKIGKMSKSDDDRRADFENVYDFDQAFVRDFAITKEEEPCPPSRP
jgi:uncharacterized repeat protein (TIGR04138 family)